jgi:hypothetical protein
MRLCRCVVLAVVAGALLVPAGARAQARTAAEVAQDPLCYCVWWVDQYVRSDTNYYRAHVASELKQRKVDRKRRDEVKQGIYDWRRDPSFKTNWCKRNQKACKAVRACLAAAVASITKDVAINRAQPDPSKRKSARDIAIDAGSLCAAFAACSLLA